MQARTADKTNTKSGLIGPAANAGEAPALTPAAAQSLAAGPREWIIASAAGALALAVYLKTGAPGAWWGDGMELTAAAWSRGIAHPTGYPVYTLLGFAWTHALRWLDPGRAMTILSAILLAASCALLTLFFRTRMIEIGAAVRLGRISGALVAAASAALTLAFAETVWDHGTFAEVYPLTYFIGAIILLLVAAPVSKIHPQKANREAQSGMPLRRPAVLGIVAGLGALNHYSLAALGPLCLFALLAWGWPRGGLGRLAPLGVFLIVSVPLVALGWAYLMLRARSNPALNWGDPSTLDRLRWVLTGGQFRGLKVELTPEAAVAGLARWLRWWGQQWLPESGVNPKGFDNPEILSNGDRYLNALPAIALGIVSLGASFLGLNRLRRLRPALGAGLMGAILMTGFFGAAYHIPDIDPFFMIALPAAMMGWIAAALALLGGLRRRWPTAGQSLAARALPLALPIALLGIHYRTIDKSWDTGPYRWGEGVMGALPQGAIVVTGGDMDIYALWYQQIVRGERPDVSVFGSNFIFQGWYDSYFARPGRPRLAARAVELAPGEKWVFDQALVEWVLEPNFKAGRRIFVTFSDSMLGEYFAPARAAGPFLPPGYRDACAYPYGLPLADLYELHDSAKLKDLDHEKLGQTLKSYENRAMLQGMGIR